MTTANFANDRRPVGVRRQPLYDQVYRELRWEIASGRLESGARLDIQEVADRLEVSRTPVREAIRQLIQEGLVASDREGRATVFEPDPEKLAEIYAVRAALESMAARLVASRRPPTDLKRIREAYRRGGSSEERGDWDAVSEANTAFHESLVVLSENEAIIRLLDTFKIHVMRHRRLALRSADRREIAHHSHQEIISLLEAGDAEGAGRRVYDEVMGAAAFALANYRPDAGAESPTIAYVRQFADTGH